MIVVEANSHLAFPTSDLDEGMLGQIKDDLLLENPERIEARNQKRYGWLDLPQWIQLYDQQAGWMRVPRGYRNQLLFRFAAARYPSCVVDATRVAGLFFPRPLGIVVRLREHQRAAIDAIAWHQVGIIEAPTGSGKTVTVLMALRQLEQRAVVVVHKKEIAAQWADRCEQFLGFRPGIVGDGQWDTSRPLTVAMVQTIAKLPPEDAFFDRFGFACLDECHHVTAASFLHVMGSFTARYRIGVSATPDRQNGLVPIAYATLGPVIHRTSREALEAAGTLLRPSVVRIRTSFAHPYWSNHTVLPGRTCTVPDCERVGSHGHRNNYGKVLTALVDDAERNELIIRTVLANREHANLVLSKQLRHLDLLRELVGDELPSFMLTGRESTADRVDVIARAAEGGCVVFSTLADEALDLPALDRIYLTWPTRSTAVVAQQIGRIVRPCPGKLDAVIYDFIDRGVAPLGVQAAERRGYYLGEGFTIQEEAPHPSAR